MWKKDVYREWFEYVKLYRLNHGKNPTPFRSFGDVLKFEFEGWWADERYGFELFCEPEVNDLVKVVDGRNPPEPNTVTLRVALNADPELTLRDFRRLMRELGGSDDYESQARFKPSAPPKAIKPDKLRQAREAFLISERCSNQTLALLELAELQTAQAKAKYGVLPWTSRREYLQSMEKGFPYILFPEEQPPKKIDGKTVDWIILDRRRYREKYKAFFKWKRTKLRVLSNHRKNVRETLEHIASGTFP